MNLIRKAFIYRLGSISLSLIMNLLIFRRLEIALGLTILFTITHTSYYYAFHRIWPTL